MLRRAHRAGLLVQRRRRLLHQREPRRARAAVGPRARRQRTDGNLGKVRELPATAEKEAREAEEKAELARLKEEERKPFDVADEESMQVWPSPERWPKS